jgi:general stress protein 26
LEESQSPQSQGKKIQETVARQKSCRENVRLKKQAGNIRASWITCERHLAEKENEEAGKAQALGTLKMAAEKLTLKAVSEKMSGIDVAILSTHGQGEEIANRPMSNNGDVEYNGTTYFFSYDGAQCVSDIERNPKVALGYATEGGLFTGAVYIAVDGSAELVRDKAAFAQHWTADLDEWFENGIDTPGLVLLKIRATRIKVWERNEEQELIL